MRLAGTRPADHDGVVRRFGEEQISQTGGPAFDRDVNPAKSDTGNLAVRRVLFSQPHLLRPGGALIAPDPKAPGYMALIAHARLTDASNTSAGQTAVFTPEVLTQAARRLLEQWIPAAARYSAVPGGQKDLERTITKGKRAFDFMPVWVGFSSPYAPLDPVRPKSALNGGQVIVERPQSA